MTKRGHYQVECPHCSTPMSLTVTTGRDQGQLWEEIELADDSPRACGCEPDDDALAAAVERVRRAA